MRCATTSRREILKGGLAAGSLFLPLPHAWLWALQSDGALKLLKAPKVALVVGNGRYKDAPELKNAPNDARAVSEVLKASGFAVTMLLDTGRDALIQAIRDYVNGMEKTKSVGLFYFAGHGVQLEWRNYMLPVDAVIDKIEDVAKQSVDIARLMEGLTKAANPMNMIILDACRENPFGTAKPVAQKGLSQMDAPPHTILAYATSPGNVASDGDGVNGLYTENLLREMKVPEAKIEDVFKRVRLGVRRKTNGAQIPWESTSLEEDFWFLPPREVRRLSEAEAERSFQEETAVWERARDSKESAPVEEYLRRYPSGRFNELAQLHLDRILGQRGEKKVEVAPQRDNPYSKGTSLLDTRCRVGDSYVVNVLSMPQRALQNTLTHTVQRITENEVHFSSGLVFDLMGNTRRLSDGRRFTDNQNVPTEFAVGRQWVTRFSGTIGGGEFTTEILWRIVAREPITVPAGTFNAFRIEGRGQSNFKSGGPADIVMTNWYAPDQVRLVTVAREETARRGGKTFRAYRVELVSFKQS